MTIFHSDMAIMVNIDMDVDEPSKIEEWKRKARQKEINMIKAKFKRTVRLCKAIYEYRDYIEQIKQCLANDDAPGASELWNELNTEVQQQLITAPLYGGPFTTQEVARIKGLWEISEDML